MPVGVGRVCVTAVDAFVIRAVPRSPVTKVCAPVTTFGIKLDRKPPADVMSALDASVVSIPPLAPTSVTVPPPPPLPGGTAHVASSRRNFVEPAVEPGSGTAPDAWLEPDATNVGRSVPTSARKVGAAAAPLTGPISATPGFCAFSVTPRVPLPVTGVFATENPDGIDSPTLVTVPPPPLTAEG
ncbi:hypothetical protein A8E35_03355 [Burkholderia cenocepacia]|nr:hypothetical protein A8E35_03355 [Burkholderia cenocepacia]